MYSQKKEKSFMYHLAEKIVDYRNIIIFLFICMAVFSFFSSTWVSVNDDLASYLDDDTESKISKSIMENEFTTYGTAQVMLANVTYSTAEKIYEELKETEGVKSVEFDDTPDHYTDVSALYYLTFEGEQNDEVSVNALKAVREKLEHYDTYIKSKVGNPLVEIINREMLIVDGVSAIVILVVLLFTSKTYAEVIVLLLTFGAAALLNKGTNFLMGEISFVTDSIAIVLQLALAIDYAIILLHRYLEELENGYAVREAVIEALTKAIPEISASSLTTISGLLALCIMKYNLGRDMGIVLIKAILLSLCAVFLLMPGLLIIFSNAIEKTRHKSFVPTVNFLGRFVYHTRYIIPLLFVLILVISNFCSSRVHYVYGPYTVPPKFFNESQIDEQEILARFGEYNQMAIIVPAGNHHSEEKLIEELEQLNYCKSVVGLANTEALNGYLITDELTPREFSEMTELDFEIAKLLYSAYAIANDNTGAVITDVDTYRVPVIDLFQFIVDKRNTVNLNLDEETSDKLDEIEPQLDDARAQLESENWSRIVFNTSMPVEGKGSIQYLDMLHGVCAKYFDEFYIASETTSCKDLDSDFQRDNAVISILSVVFVVAVLLFTFKSVGLPVLLIMIIQGSIWCNFAAAYLNGKDVYFLTYLIISAIQMGANIDYAIVISSRYLEAKKDLPLREAITETLNQAFPTILTSGTILSAAGFCIELIATNGTISGIGKYLGKGTLISMCLVMLALPQILLLGDIIISKTSFNINLGVNRTNTSGLIYINGRVKGSLNGILDAQVRGVFRGDLSAAVDVGSIQRLSEEQLLEKEGRSVSSGKEQHEEV